MNEHVRRAMAAFFRTGGNIQPSNASAEELIDGKRYVVLRNVKGVLAVYRVKNNDRLKCLRRWPTQVELEEQAVAS